MKKVSELEGAELDYWVAKAEGHDFDSLEDFLKDRPSYKPHGLYYSSDWAQGGPIIEREKIQLVPMDNGEWAAYKVKPEGEQEGQTPLEAAMRAYVASKFGEDV